MKMLTDFIFHGPECHGQYFHRRDYNFSRKAPSETNVRDDHKIRQGIVYCTDLLETVDRVKHLEFCLSAK